MNAACRQVEEQFKIYKCTLDKLVSVPYSQRLVCYFADSIVSLVFPCFAEVSCVLMCFLDTFAVIP